MTCEHLIELEKALQQAGIRETFRGKPWQDHCREWVYFDCVLAARRIRRKFGLPDCVQEHAHVGKFDSDEAGFYCSMHHDAILGHHPSHASGPRWPRWFEWL